MISDQDITKLTKVFATKEELADLKTEFAELRDTVLEKIDEMNARLDEKFDRFLGKVQALEIDNSAGAAILYRHEMNFTYLAKHLGITLPA